MIFPRSPEEDTVGETEGEKVGDKVGTERERK